MNELDQQFIQNDQQRTMLEQASVLVEKFAKRAHNIDQEAMFPFENFSDLKKANFLSLTVPKKYGGNEISLYDFLLIQEKLAQGDAATTLSLGWHLGIMMHYATNQSWSEKRYEQICRDVVSEQKLINSIKSEKGTGSPARGGKPQTTARRNGDMWIINGRKNFASLAPALDFFVISATIAETGEVADFLITKEADGMSIEQTWDTLGMRGTRSDDLVLEDVVVPVDALLESGVSGQKGTAAGWLLHIPACYIGVAIAARNEAVSYAKQYKPNHLTHPIKELPEVRSRIAEIDLELMSARHFMYSVAQRWDTQLEQRKSLGAELAAVKTYVTNTAISIVDKAMRVLGGQSLYTKNPMQRYYRDVRAGLHNPPGDDITYKILAKRAFLNE